MNDSHQFAPPIEQVKAETEWLARSLGSLTDAIRELADEARKFREPTLEQEAH